MITEEIWTRVGDAVADLGPHVFDDPRVDSERLRIDGVRYLTRLISAAILQAMEAGDADYPHFVQSATTKIQWALPAVDAYYLLAPVHGKHTYRIHGDRGSAHLFDVEVWNGDPCHFSSFTVESTCLDYTVGDDGKVEFVLSTEEQPGNWLRLPDGPGTVIVRQYFNDWETEQPGMVYIERDGAQYPPPPVTEEVMERRLAVVEEFLAEVPGFCNKVIQTYYAPDPSTIDFAPLGIGFAELHFGRGNYRCEPDEAVIIETPDPACHYWNYQLCNHFWEALDWNVRLTAVNGHQAVIDDDGVFRAVIAHSDPGVPNWLDTAGRNTGLIAARYYHPGTITAPTVKVVPLAEVRNHLPASTPTVTPQQRQELLRRRFLAARRTWRE